VATPLAGPGITPFLVERVAVRNIRRAGATYNNHGGLVT
jgi:hypothetical protein